MMCWEWSWYSEEEINWHCKKCGNSTVDGDAYECCTYSPCECDKCGWSPCDGSC